MHCVMVFGTGLVCSIDCWNVSTMWSSLYDFHCDISSCLLVTVMPLSFVDDHFVGKPFMTCMYCASVQVSRSSARREIVCGREGCFIFSGERWRFRLVEPGSGSSAGSWSTCCRSLEPQPAAPGLASFSVILVGSFRLCKSSCCKIHGVYIVGFGCVGLSGLMGFRFGG